MFKMKTISRSKKLVSMMLLITLLYVIVFAGVPQIASAVGQPVQVWFSSEDGTYKLSQQPDLTVTSPDGASITAINVDPRLRYQSMLGMGSSLEESTVYNLSRQTASNRAAVLKSLVDPVGGMGWNFMRICFGSSDFTGRPWYTYDDMPAGQTDVNLTHFSIQKDIDYNIIAVIKEAMSYNPDLKIFASVWSPPAWMKDSGNICGGSLLSQYYDVAAKYYRMAIQAYEAQGIPIYAITVQNESSVNSSSYPTSTLTQEQERDFVKKLGAEFTNYNINTKIWILDDSFGQTRSGADYARFILDDSTARQYVDGTAFHDYWGEPSEMTKLHSAYPDRPIYLTERSTWGAKGMDRIMQYFRNWASSYDAWVTFLDDQNLPNNGPYSPGATFVRANHDNPDNYWYIPEYYLLGQVTKFVKRGALRIDSDYGSSNTVTDVAFKNPDGKIVVAVANQSTSSQQFKILCQGGQITATIPAKTVATYMWTPVEENPPAPGWYQNFESGTGFSAGSYATTSISNSSANTGGYKSLKLDVGFTWGGTGWASIYPQAGSSMDISGFTLMNFYIKDTQGSNTQYITFIDAGNKIWSGWNEMKPVQNQWTKISFDMSRVTGIDKAHIKEIRIGEYNSGTYYIDDVFMSNDLNAQHPLF